MNAPVSTVVPRFEAPYAADDDALIAAFAKQLHLDAQQNDNIDTRATRYVEAIRDHAGSIGGVEDFLREYGLSTPEGLAMMVLAEALLRVPDAGTQDRLIEDKLLANSELDEASCAPEVLQMLSKFFIDRQL